MLKKSWFWVAILLCVALISAGYLFFLPKEKGHTATLWQNGEIIRTVDLTENQEFTVTCEEGYNVVRVQDGQIAVIESDCPEQYCVGQGFVDSYLIPITCLPHKLVIEIDE